MSGHMPWRDIKHKAKARQVAAARAELKRVIATTCFECGRTWDDPSERWRSYLTVDDAAELFCPECSDREFEGA